MATGTIKINAVKSGHIGESNISTSSGSVVAGSGVNYCYDDNFISINYHIRLQNTTGRPTVTVTGLPNMGSGFSEYGDITLVLIGTTVEASDVTHINTSGTTMTIDMYNFIGRVPSGSGYIIYTGSFTAPIAQ